MGHEKRSNSSLGYSLVRSLSLVVLGGVAVWSWTAFQRSRYEAQAVLSTQAVFAEVFPLDNPVQNRLHERFKDVDADLVADGVTDPALFLKPETLAFSYIASENADHQAGVWRPLLDALGEATGQSIEFLQIKKADDQLRALKEGRLHITALNTGLVPRAANACGFVPVSALGRDDGSYGYTMQIIVPSGSKLQKVDDLRGERITFTSRKSNSGFKAAVVLLRQDFGLVPGADYDFGFSTSHDESIKRVAAGEIVAAAVASDMIELLESSGEVAEGSVRAIYTSESFPAATFGYLHNLSPELAEKVAKVLREYQFEDDVLSGELGGSGYTRLQPVNYKNDWSVVRRIDDAFGKVHQVD